MLDDRPSTKTAFSKRFKDWVPCYFFSPTDLFFSRRTEAWHFLHLVAWRAFLAPHRRQTLRKSRRFWAICFFVTSAIGI